jgi:hypothetical protein
LIAGALPALLFPFLGLATSFISMAKYDDYAACVTLQTVADKTYDDKIKLALRNYACWYYAFTLCKNFYKIIWLKCTSLSYTNHLS